MSSVHVDSFIPKCSGILVKRFEKHYVIGLRLWLGLEWRTGASVRSVCQRREQNSFKWNKDVSFVCVCYALGMRKLWIRSGFCLGTIPWMPFLPSYFLIIES